MDSTRLVHPTSGTGAAAARATINPANDARRVTASARPAVETAPSTAHKSAGYGLPCAKCRTYYLATLAACPICKSAERVSATPVMARNLSPTDAQPDAAVLNEERESFLREFKAKLYEAHMQINPSAYLRCTFSDENQAAHESASVCKPCYDQLQSRVDVFEAALHMDANEAAQVIYDAVWADTSDSSRTYFNAAQALLGELRKRAGIRLILGKSHPLPH